MATLSAPTVEELISDVRSLLNQPSSTNSFWSDEELASYLDAGVRRYFAEAIMHAEGLFTTQTDLDLVQGQELVSLPADFFSVRCLYRTVGGGYAILPYRNNLTEGYATTGSMGGDFYQPYYYLRGNSLVLRPLPDFSETAGLRIEYVQFPETLVTGGDSLTSQVSPVFKDLVIAYAVYKAKLKESLVSGTDTTALIKENLSDLFSAFRDALIHRSMSPTAIKPFNPEEC